MAAEPSACPAEMIVIAPTDAALARYIIQTRNHLMGRDRFPDWSVAALASYREARMNPRQSTHTKLFDKIHRLLGFKQYLPYF